MKAIFQQLDYKNLSELEFSEKYDFLPSLIVVIPSFAEKSLIPVIRSLESCHPIKRNILICCVINEPESVNSEHRLLNQQCFDEMRMIGSFKLPVRVLFVNRIPDKIAGVGTARKIGMDYAVQLMKDNELGNSIIVNLDADCVVSPNYFIALDDHFSSCPESELATIHFEHDLEGLEREQFDAIVDYELHLRYFIEMQRWLQLPFAYHTIGSAFAVRASAYLSVGGMNRRKAGEDFYFIHKFSKKGTIKDLTDCTVYPSGRKSFRVPFGTGKAVSDLLQSKDELETYHPNSFRDLQQLVACIEYLYNDGTIISLDLPLTILSYLEDVDAEDVIQKLKSNSRSIKTFRKAFYQWFDAFRLMKFLHYSRNHFYPNIPVIEALRSTKDYLDFAELKTNLKGLTYLRKRHRSQSYNP